MKIKAKTTNKVMETADYKQFTITKANRGIIGAHVRRLARSLDEHGWIDSMPMTVRRNCTSLVIIDGQNRYRAAQSLGIPVKYVVIEGEQANVPPNEFNDKVKRWTAIDFVKSFANQGKADYQKLLDFMEKHRVPLTVAGLFLAGVRSNSAVIESGKFKISDEAWATEKLAALQALKPLMPYSAYKVNFVGAFVKACHVDGFDPHRLVAKMRKCPDKIVDYATESSFVQMIEDIYNFRSREGRLSIVFNVYNDPANTVAGKQTKN